MAKIDFKKSLNSEQERAATAEDGIVLVLAAAGTGKTRTIVYRVAYLVEKGVEPEKILLLTFTNRAAREMLERAQVLLGYGIGGIWGSLATGLFASRLINPGGADGLFHGGASLIGKQAIAVAAVLAYSFAVTFVILKVVGIFGSHRLSKADEDTGLDLSQHGEIAYDFS